MRSNLSLLTSKNHYLAFFSNFTLVRGGFIYGVLGFVSTCLISQGFATTANAANPKQLEQLLNTKACPKCDLREAQLSDVSLRRQT
jgi:hypothetical protein